MKLILASSATLLKYLHIIDYYPVDEEIVVIANESRHGFKFSGSEEYMDCEVMRGSFIHTVKAQGLQRLRRFLQMVEDQPITIGFDNGWVWIKEAIL